MFSFFQKNEESQTAEIVVPKESSTFDTEIEELRDTLKDLPKVEEKTNSAVKLEATMATAVPIVLNLFSQEFSWFAKEWDRIPVRNKQKFTTKMRNELMLVNAANVNIPVSFFFSKIT